MINKIINSEGQQYEPETISELVFDAKPIVNSFNAVTSDAVARAVAGASGEVPAVTESDNGKVLKAIYDEGGAAVEWGDAAPAVTVDQTYNALSENPQSGTAVAEAIAAIPAPSVDEVPDVTSSDDGKVLTASYSGGTGSYSWQTAQGGGGVSILENGGLALYQDKAYVKTAEGKGVKIDSGNVVADFDVVQPCLTFGSDFKFNGATQSTSTVSNDNKWVAIPLNVSTKFTLPGSLPAYAYGSAFGGRLELQIVDSNGTKLTTLKSKSFSTTSMPITAEFYQNITVPAGNSGNYLRWELFTTGSYPNPGTESTLAISNFSTTTACFVVPYSGTLALVSPVPQVIANWAAMGHSSNDFTYTITDSGLYSVSVCAYDAISEPTTAIARISVSASTEYEANYVYANADVKDAQIQFLRKIEFNNTQLKVKFFNSSNSQIAYSSFYDAPRIAVIKYA